MTNTGKIQHKLSSASDQFRKVLLSYWALVIRWSTSAIVPKKCMKWWLTRGNVRLCWPPSAKFPNGGKRSTPNVPDVNQHSELGNVNSTDVWTIFSKRFKVEATFAQTFPMWQLIEPKYYEGGHCQCVLRSHRFFYIHPLMSGRWHRHLTWSCEPHEIHYHVRGGGIPWHPTSIATRAAQFTGKNWNMLAINSIWYLKVMNKWLLRIMLRILLFKCNG